MTESAPLVTIFCAPWRRHAQVRRGEPLPEGLGRAYGAAALLGDVSGTLAVHGADA